MKKIGTWIILVVLSWAGGNLLLPMVSATTLDQFRCPDGSLIGINDRPAEVRRKCGEPATTDSRLETRSRVYYWEKIAIEEWTYNWGPTSFLIHLTFENGRLIRIESGEYGY